jgi:hypothetical protein
LESSRRRSKGLAFSHFGRAGQGLRGEDASRSAFAGFRGGELGAPVGTLADRGDERRASSTAKMTNSSHETGRPKKIAL